MEIKSRNQKLLEWRFLPKGFSHFLFTLNEENRSIFRFSFSSSVLMAAAFAYNATDASQKRVAEVIFLTFLAMHQVFSVLLVSPAEPLPPEISCNRCK